MSQLLLHVVYQDQLLPELLLLFDQLSLFYALPALSFLVAVEVVDFELQPQDRLLET